MKIKPFLKWVGGKQKLVKTLLLYVPEQYNVYHEPFLGGGALLLAIQPEHAYASDVNRELIHTYRVLSKKEHCQPTIS